MDGMSSAKWSSAWIVLEGPGNIVIEHALKFEFTASNNQAEYKALIIDMILALEMRATRLKAKNDSQLVANQVLGQYQANEHMLIKYPHKVRHFSSRFISLEVEHVPSEQYLGVNLLSKLATSKVAGFNRTVHT